MFLLLVIDDEFDLTVSLASFWHWRPNSFDKNLRQSLILENDWFVILLATSRAASEVSFFVECA